MKNTTKVVLLVLALCTVLAGCAVTGSADSGSVVVPVVPVNASQGNGTVPAPELKIETSGSKVDYRIEANGLDFYVFTLSPNQVALKYPSGIEFNDINAAAVSFSEKYSDLVRDAVLGVDEQNLMAVLTFPAAVSNTTLKDLEKDLNEFIPSYVDSYIANAAAVAEPVEIKVPETKAAATPAVKTSVPAITTATTATTATTTTTTAPAPAQAPAEEPEAKAPAKSNAGTVILIVVLVIIAVSCVVYFINRKKKD